MAFKTPWNSSGHYLDKREPHYCAEFRTEDGERCFTPWSRTQSDIVDYIGLHGGSIKKLFQKENGVVYIGTAQGKMELSEVQPVYDIEALKHAEPSPHFSAEDLIA